MTDEIKKNLIEAASTVRENSYSPYSHFKVGAALLTDNDQIFMGTNVENASYGGTVCAERIAIFSSISAGEKNIKAIAIVADTDEPCSPCGFCRQVMSEFMKPDGLVIMTNLKRQTLEKTVSEILPLAFSKDDFVK